MKLIPSPITMGSLVLAAISSVYGQEQTAASTNNVASTGVPGSNPPPPPAAVHFEGTDLHVGSLPPVSFHGFASQGFLASTDYNYLGKTKVNGTFQFNEFGINATMSPFPHTRIAAQAFAFDLGQVGNDEPMLDYGLIDYNFCDAFGIRGGRIRRPGGIYNEILDVDVARTSILLPQGLYQGRWRDFLSSVDGGSVYGNINMGKAGGLSYELYSGMINLSQTGGVARDVQDILFNKSPFLSLDSVEDGLLSGGQFWWYTPVEGLRSGVSFGDTTGMGYNFHAPTRFGPLSDHADMDCPYVIYSLEYVWKGWTFQSEYGTLNKFTTVTGPIAPGRSHLRTEVWYVNVAYRFNPWFEVGSYYTQDYEDVNHEGNPRLFQKDAALTFRFDPKPWWTVKLEGHVLNGTGLLKDTPNNPVQRDDIWYMLAVKTTFSF